MRPRRLIWTTPYSFRVTGIGNGSRFQRSHLRFKSPDEASQVASTIRRSFSVLEEPLVPVEEFPVQVRFLISAGYVVLQLYIFLFRLIVAAIILVFSGEFGPFGFAVGIVLVIVYFGLFFWSVFVKLRRRTQGWLRFEGKSIAVRTPDSWAAIFPRTMEWRSSTVFILRGPGTKLEVSLPNNQNTIQITSKMKALRPEIREIPVS